MGEEIHREMERARRHGWPLTGIVVRAFQIERAERALRVGLRAHDVVERHDDELICVAAPLSQDVARRRLIEISATHQVQFEAGLSQLHGPEPAALFLERARDDLNGRVRENRTEQVAGADMDVGYQPVAEAKLVQLHREGDVATLTPPARIDSLAAARLSSALFTCFAPRPPRRLRIDLSKTTHLDGPGLRALRLARGHTARMDCVFQIIRPQALSVRRALITAGLDGCLV